MPVDGFGHHRITIDEARLNANYEKMMDEVYLLFHTHPTMLTPISLTEGDIAQAAEYNAMARELARQQVNNPEWRRFLPNGCQIVTRYDGVQVIRMFRDGKELAKKTIYPRDFAYINGLPVAYERAVRGAPSRSTNDMGCLVAMFLIAIAWGVLLVWVLLR